MEAAHEHDDPESAEKHVHRRLILSVWEVSFSVDVPPADEQAARVALAALLEDAALFASTLQEALRLVAFNLTAFAGSFSMGDFAASPPDNVVTELLAEVERAEVRLVDQLLASNASSLNSSVEGMTVVAKKINAEQIESNASIIFDVGDDVTVEVSPDTIESLGVPEGAGVVIVITPLTAIIDEVVEDLTGNETANGTKIASDTVVQASVKIDIYDSEGGVYSASNLETPILFSLPIVETEGYILECGFWDVDLAEWTTKGVTTISRTNTTLTCSTTHLSLFGAIARSILSTFLCSNAVLLSAEGFQEILKGDWFYDLGALVLWFTLLVFAMFFTIAVKLDISRYREGKWSDSHFLIPEGEMPPDVEDDDTKAKGYLGMLACVTGCFHTCCTSGEVIYEIVSEIVNEFFSEFFEYIGEVRDICSGICEGISEAVSGASSEAASAAVAAAVLFVTGKAINLSSHRSACAEIGVHHGDEYKEALSEILHIAEQADKKELAKARSSVAADPETNQMVNDPETGVSAKSLRSSTTSGSGSNKSPKRAATMTTKKLRKSLDTSRSGVSLATQRATQRAQHLSTLYALHTERLKNAQFRVHRLRNMPFNVSRQIFKLGPLGSCLVFSIYAPSSIRVLRLFCELFGAILVATLFMEAEGGAPDEDNDDSCEPEDPAGIIGRLIAIGIASGFLAALPVAILNRLHQRRFIPVDYEGSPHYLSQLRNWKVMDVFFWIVGLGYGGFCVVYVMLFLSNVAPEDQLQWMITAGATLTNELVAIPLSVALAPTVLAAILICMLSCWFRQNRHDVIERIVKYFEEEDSDDEAETPNQQDEERGAGDENGAREVGVPQERSGDDAGPPAPNSDQERLWREDKYNWGDTVAV